MPAAQSTVLDRLNATVLLLRSWGYTVKGVKGWRTRRARSDITFSPAGVIVHHTGDNTTPQSLLVKGRTGLPGPLCNVEVQRTGVITMIAAGYANHAGINSKAAVEKVLAGATSTIAPGADTAGYSANRLTYGIEAQGGKGWTATQHKSVVAVCAALAIVSGWPIDRPPVGAHKEITRRKPLDPYGVDMGAFRREVAALIATKTTTPPKEPTVPSAVNLRAASINIQAKRWGGGKYIDDAKFIDKTLAPSILMVQEAEEIARDQIVKTTGFKVYPHRYVGLLWDGSKWTHSEKFTLDLGSTYHGLVGTKLTRRNNGLALAAASVHIRPTSAFANAADVGPGKRADIAAVIKALAKWQKVVVGGDWNTPVCRELMEAAGYTLVTPWAPTHDSGSILDAIFVRGLTARSAGSIIDSPHSDHHGLIANLTIPAISTL